MSHDNDEDNNRRDLTRIEDLSEFLHEDDPELESKFGDFDQPTPEATSAGVGLDDLDLPPAIPIVETLLESEAEQVESDLFSDSVEETNDEILEDVLDNTLFELSTEDNEFNIPNNEEFAFAEESVTEAVTAEEGIQNETISDFPDNFLDDEFTSMPMTSSPPEKFEEVKNFTQNFSYGQIEGGGNPPFSLVIRNLKFKEEKEDIITLLNEFGLASESSIESIEKALDMGSLLIPQISEYSAIVLAHKFRRFDCDIEIGLSDEIHPSKSGDQNPRGLVKKDSLRQNHSESYKKDKDETPSNEIIVSTTSTLEGHIIKKYIGVQAAFAIVDEEELERLKHVQVQRRTHSLIENYETEESLTSERAFIDYQSSFEHLFVDLADQLKARAMKEKANALLGLNYQLTSMPFQKSSQGSSCYQLTASATLAIVRPE